MIRILNLLAGIPWPDRPPAGLLLSVSLCLPSVSTACATYTAEGLKIEPRL